MPQMPLLGTCYASRDGIRLAGFHLQKQGGIHPIAEGTRAESVVISGGYAEDRDYGNVIFYTGQGGLSDTRPKVQISDQKIERGNKSLVAAENAGTLVGVFRGSGGDPNFSPTTGYRYDGLYEVRRHWFEPSAQGPLVVRFELVGHQYGVQSLATNPPGLNVPPSGKESPDRKHRVSQNLIRDQANVDWIKNLYDNTCQVCGTRLIGNAGPISIGAHIHPLGKPDNGPDVVGNMLCLCPNCHAIFDSGAFFIENDCLTISWGVQSGNSAATLGPQTLTVKQGHQIDAQCVKHHRVRVCGIP